MDDRYFMEEALKEAKKAYDLGEVPVGAVIVKDEEIIARAFNSVETDKSALHHAEMKAIEAASKILDSWRLNDCSIYVTLEPCAMCSGAIVKSRIKRLVIGTMEAKAGCAGSVINLCDDGAFNHRVEIETGVLQEKAAKLLKEFFKGLRYGK